MIHEIESEKKNPCNHLLAANRRKVDARKKVLQTLLARETDWHAKIANLNATTEDEETLFEAAPAEEIQEELRAALARAQAQRHDALTAFTKGQHAKVGAASRILSLTPDVVQMIIDRL